MSLWGKDVGGIVGKTFSDETADAHPHWEMGLPTRHTVGNELSFPGPLCPQSHLGVLEDDHCPRLSWRLHCTDTGGQLLQLRCPASAMGRQVHGHTVNRRFSVWFSFLDRTN